MYKINYEKRKNIPELPGCYIYYNNKKEVIYIGKAKNLLNRVNSYFERFQSTKTDELVKNIVYFDFIVTNTEKESLLLEINLIQKHKPKYNILLKDGRNYPYIRISSDSHPKVDVILNKYEDKIKGKYYGPFTDSYTAKKLTSIINTTFKFRKCKSIPKRKCIYYDIKQCYGPCIKSLPQNIYDDDLKIINDFFNSKPKRLISLLKEIMYDYSSKNEFEEAMKFRDALKYINEFISAQIIDTEDKRDFDIISIKNYDNIWGMYTLSIRGGLLLAHDFIVGDNIKIDDALINRYFENNINIYIDNLKIFKKYKLILKRLSIAKESSKLELSLLAKKNLEIQISKQVLEEEKKKLINNFFLNTLEIKKFNNIFLLDISHLSGESNVGGLVCFTNNIKNKKMYRKYKLSFNDNNDIKSIDEIVNRIISNEIIMKNMDVFIIDGGINQLNIVNKVFNENNINIPVISLEKNAKHQTANIIYKKEIVLRDITILSFFNRMQEEVHRFANLYMSNHNLKQKKSSIFDGIKGVGPKRKVLLENNFKSLEDLSSSSVEDLMDLGIGEKLAIDILIRINESI